MNSEEPRRHVLEELKSDPRVGASRPVAGVKRVDNQVKVR